MVKAYVEGGDGPSAANLQLDTGVESNIRSAWNREVFNIILAEMAKEREEKPWDIPAPSDGLLLQAIEQRCTNLRCIYRATLPKITEGGTLETPAQVGGRIAHQGELTLLTNRQRRRRVTVGA